MKLFKSKTVLIFLILLLLIATFITWYLLNFYSKATIQDYLKYKVTFCDDILGNNTNRAIIAFSYATIVSEEEYPKYKSVIDELKTLELPGKYEIKKIISLLEERKNLAPEFKEASNLAWEKYKNVCFFCDDYDFAEGRRQSTEEEWQDFNSYTQPLHKKMREIDTELLNSHENIFNNFKKDIELSGMYMCKDEEGLRELFIGN